MAVYECSFGGVPFLSDKASAFSFSASHSNVGDHELGTSVKKYMHKRDLMGEVEKLLPRRWMNEYVLPSEYPGKNLGAIAANWRIGPDPASDEMTVGTYYYPTGASRWSIFRGLMTSSMKKAVDAATGGFVDPATFVMQAAPTLTGPQKGLPASSFRVSTSLYCLPPRPLGETAGSKDGLYLVTLVDERWFFQGTPATLRPTKDSTWTAFANSLASQLGISLSFTTIPAAYGQPEPDSQFWANFEYGSYLLDAIAYNVGRTVVRKLDGTYTLEDPASSAVIIAANRGAAPTVVRTAGGDIFGSGVGLPGGNNQNARNAIVPRSIWITFPKYVTGDDPVPHYLNSRTQSQRPSSWYEDSYGEVHAVNVPVQSGGSTVSGLTGVNTTNNFHTTAKALYASESAAASGNLPLNSSGLVALSMQIAADYYGQMVTASLDEAYPGTFAWTPEGVHDIVWTYSDLMEQADTRIVRSEWNEAVRELQHATPALANQTIVAKGAGGHSVAQTVRDSYDVNVSTTLATSCSFNDTVLNFASAANFPTQNRWKGTVENETILFEGTGGSTAVQVVYRGTDGTVAVAHGANVGVQQVTPDTTYGANLVNFEKGQFVFPGQETSGGIRGVAVVPQTQTVRVLTNSGVSINGLTYYSGTLETYDLTQSTGNSKLVSRESVWVLERNQSPLASGRRYDGQLAGFSAGAPSPAYAVNASLSSGDSAFLTLNNIVVYPGSGLVTVLSGVPITPSSPKVLFTCGDGAAIEGFGGPTPALGQQLFLVNVGPSACVLRDRSTLSGIQQIRTPLGFLDLTYSGFKSDYTLWPGDGCTLEFNTGFSVVTVNSGIIGNPSSGLPAGSGVWSFDDPTIGAGIVSGYINGQIIPKVKTYATRFLAAGSGLISIDSKDGINTFCLDRAIFVKKNTGGDLGPEAKLNFIEGANTTLTVTDDPANNKIDVTIASTGGLASPLTTKGDVWGYSNTDARIPVGSNNQVLTADSTQTLGVKWATPSTGGISYVTVQEDDGSPSYQVSDVTPLVIQTGKGLSLDGSSATLIVSYATATVSGTLSTASQTIAGLKTFINSIIVGATSSTVDGNVQFWCANPTGLSGQITAWASAGVAMGLKILSGTELRIAADTITFEDSGESVAPSAVRIRTGIATFKTGITQNIALARLNPGGAQGQIVVQNGWIVANTPST